MANIGLGAAIDFGVQILAGENVQDALAKTLLHVAVGIRITSIVSLLGLSSGPALLAITLGVIGNSIIDALYDNR